MMEKKISQMESVVDRRTFLKRSGLLGLAVASAGLIPLTAEAVRFSRKSYKVSKTRLGIGTFVSMTLIHPSRDKSEEAMGHAFEEIDRLTGLMNRFDEAAAISQLNREGVLKDVPPELTHVVERSRDYYRITGGAFDISVKPLVDLFQESFADGKDKAPTDSEIENVLGRVGGNKIDVSGRTIRFREPGMGITLDGIAKGYIVDMAAGVLAAHGIENYLINAGGEIIVSGRRKDGKPWTVAIEDPEKKQPYRDIIRLTEGAVATSGNYEVFFDREKMFHHIVNPFDGHSPQLATSVSVVAPTVMDADALSTGIFIMGPGEGTRFIASRPKCECFILDRVGNTFRSPGWKRMGA